jgi:hypothetical protein
MPIPLSMGGMHMTVLRSAALRVQAQVDACLAFLKGTFECAFEYCRVSAYLLLFILVLLIDGLWNIVFNSKSTLEGPDEMESS